MKKFAIFASGSGSNAQVLFDHVASGAIPGVVACLVCDRPGAGVIERAEQAGVETLVYRPRDFATKGDYEAEVVRELQARDVDYVVLAGYMRLCGPTFLAAYAGRTINVHPSLLPMFPGATAIADAVAAGVKYTGVTVHFIDEGMDTGPIIRQETVRVHVDDTLESVAAKIHEVEHRLLPEVTKALVSGSLRMEHGKALFTSGGM
ncbi:phosphoribosylglycinamide formyltransferase [Tumebacillus permanentifrigoris]|uniref:Phosphoribosylglycinamide formyltransferase n=1 Tax=Tumebacillus permanentifrigoris TaxID=378543 RepID=A0A316D6S5_9BACL|nr:phosphoribosylglycinamide formyltransferase [Tumebacillus permanentifrigoris]PWK09677.1 formyltetrahydrofolate-dependent phosphoribosylglycinamide formyltransferase [Tumebacillus permanentifrigoris]